MGRRELQRFIREVLDEVELEIRSGPPRLIAQLDASGKQLAALAPHVSWSSPRAPWKWWQECKD